MNIPSYAHLSNYSGLVREIMANGENGAKIGNRSAKAVDRRLRHVESPQPGRRGAGDASRVDRFASRATD